MSSDALIDSDGPQPYEPHELKAMLKDWEIAKLHVDLDKLGITLALLLEQNTQNYKTAFIVVDVGNQKRRIGYQGVLCAILRDLLQNKVAIPWKQLDQNDNKDVLQFMGNGTHLILNFKPHDAKKVKIITPDEFMQR